MTFARLGVDVRAVPLQPQDLRADRLRGQRVAAARRAARPRRSARSAPRSRRAAACRRRRARRSSAARPSASTGSMHGPIALRRDRLDVGGRDAALGDELVAEVKRSRPTSPRSARCSAQPGCGTSILCGLRRSRRCGRPRRRARPWTRTCRYRCRGSASSGIVVAVEAELCVDARLSRAEQQLRQPSRSPRSQTLQRRVRVAHREAQIDRRRRPAPTSCT